MKNKPHNLLKPYLEYTFVSWTFMAQGITILNDQIMKGFHCLKVVNDKESISGYDSVLINTTVF